jgi:hypothetical protein
MEMEFKNCCQNVPVKKGSVSYFSVLLQGLFWTLQVAYVWKKPLQNNK